MEKKRATRDLTIGSGAMRDIVYRAGAVVPESMLAKHPEWEEYVESDEMTEPEEGKTSKASRAAKKAAADKRKEPDTGDGELTEEEFPTVEEQLAYQTEAGGPKGPGSVPGGETYESGTDAAGTEEGPSRTGR